MLYTNLEDFNFDLPEELIAKYPSKTRDSSRLMIVNRSSGQIKIEDKFSDIVNYLDDNYLLVYNNTKVENRRVFLENNKGGQFEVLFLKEFRNGQYWHVLIKKSRKLREGDILISKITKQKFIYMKKYNLTVLKITKYPIEAIFFQKEGEIPIPPYFKRRPDEIDKIRYQTIFAKNSGSLAAPTAGLHFTEELKLLLESRGVKFNEIELQIGYGTFAPLQEKNFIKGKLHKEFYSIKLENAIMMKNYRSYPRKLIAIGTTTLRALESAYDSHNKEYINLEGSTELFIRPEDTIYSIDGLITNFHLPKSSLLLLVAAFMGVDLMLEAYRIAISEKMRFFSYGDAMLII